MKDSIVFFGSGPLAAASLKFLNENFTIEAVVTKPTTKEEMAASAPGVPLHTVSNKRELTALLTDKPFKSRVAILVDFGIIVEKAVIDYFPLGIINSHFSLLPRWRGADPISFAILKGDAKTGVSLMLIDEGLDTGKLITQKVLHIKPDATAPSLTEELIELSNGLLKDFVPRYAAGEVKPHNQPHPDRVTHSHKLEKKDGVIDWNKPAEQIEREIRAYLGWPGSRTTIADKDVIITQAHMVPTNHGEKPGALEVVREANALMVETGKGMLCIDWLKPAGKNEMSSAEFIRGYLRQ
jgi:methionyl-tRNA formyltransferase